MSPAAMQAALKATKTRLVAHIDVRFEALEATVRQSNELLVKRVDHIAAEHSVLLAKIEKLGAAVLDSHRSIPACHCAQKTAWLISCNA
ncbi:unnamed protein product [Dibothriocephalus latus]|uniref:Uncharacterized protein n=1 Tax=Dibothriocephalus latus TaxID=60516 RepID=A0A3P7MRA8_DIBLA|nr:unnamed protein product [Dibothriocephalus latus]